MKLGSYHITDYEKLCVDNGDVDLENEIDCYNTKTYVQKLYPTVQLGEKIEMAERPKGCFLRWDTNNEWIFWNTHATGRKHLLSKSICIIGKLRIPPQYFLCNSILSSTNTVNKP